MTHANHDGTATTGASGFAHRVSRRTLLQALGLGAATAVVGGLPANELDVAAQERGQRPAGGPDLEQVLWDLEYDPERIFRFVADEIAYEAYSGALRGAKGTHWSFAGNSVDQALLLAEMLTLAQVQIRFAAGPLAAPDADALLASMNVDADTARQHARRVSQGERPNLSVRAELSPDQRTTLESPEAVRDRLLGFAREETDLGLEVIEQALASASVSLSNPEFALPERERTQHVWVQYAAGPEWIDLDPSIVNAEAGKAYAKQTETWDAIPDELFHRVRFRAVVERNVGGVPERSEAFVHESRAVDVVGVPVVFAHVQANAMTQLGVTINGMVDGSTQYVPTLLAGDEGSVGDAISIGAGGGALDVLGGETEDGGAIGEWLEIEVVPVDGAVRSTTREVFDRIGIEKRAAGGIDLAALPPVELLDDPELGRVFLPLEAVWLFGVIGGRVPGSYFEQDYTISDIEADIALLVHGYHAARDGLQLELAINRGYRWYHDEPNLTAGLAIPVQLKSGEMAISTSLDLVHQSYAIVAVDGAEATVQPRVLAGVLAHVAERMGTEAAGAVTPASPPRSGSTGGVFRAARTEGISIRTLVPGSADVTGLAVSEAAKIRISEALQAGYVVVVPERAVEVDGIEQVGWWQIDPVTGRTFDLMENGRGFSPIGEDTVILAWGPAWRAIWAWRGLSFAIGMVVGFATAMAILTYPN